MGLNDMSKNNLTFMSDLTSVTKDGLDDAYAYLKECQAKGVNACVGLQYKCDFYPSSPYRHKWLYARDITTLDNLYMQVYGYPKLECFKRKAQTQTRLSHQENESGYVEVENKIKPQIKQDREM